jgi:hypothetical protein
MFSGTEFVMQLTEAPSEVLAYNVLTYFYVAKQLTQCLLILTRKLTCQPTNKYCVITEASCTLSHFSGMTLQDTI